MAFSGKTEGEEMVGREREREKGTCVFVVSVGRGRLRGIIITDPYGLLVIFLATKLLI
jgi:hypothetical protein